MELVLCVAITHLVELDDVGVRLAAFEIVARAIEAEDETLGFLGRARILGGGGVVVSVHLVLYM
jgi:hypothetical protein